MSRRTMLALLLVAGLATAGCLGSQPQGVSNASTEDVPQPGNETSGQDEQEANRSSNRTDEDRGEGSSNRTGGDAEDEGNRSSEQSSHPPWPAVEQASVRPGAQIWSQGQCTSNFLFRTPDNATLMLGVAAHCLADTSRGEGASGCSEAVDPLAPGAEVEIEGAQEPGRLVYSSWYTMQQNNVTDEDVCYGNDFALVAIDAADRGSVHPAVEGFGGPTGLAASGDVDVGDDVRWYGATSLTPETRATSRHEGKVVYDGDWRFQAYSAAPGLPGDSGSGFMLEDGSAAGVLSTLQAVYPGANGATKLDPALSFARDHGVEAELVTWPVLASGPLD